MVLRVYKPPGRGKDSRSPMFKMFKHLRIPGMMASYDFNQLYNERIRKLKPYVLRQASGDEDLVQEQYIGIFLALKHDPDCSDSYLKQRARWNMLKFLNRGSSLSGHLTDEYDDNNIGHKTCKYVNHDVPEDHIIEKNTYERFYRNLSDLERWYVQHRMLGWPAKAIMDKYDISKRKLAELKDAIRFKLNEVSNY